MKKRILVLTAMAMLSLSACGTSSTPANELPSGGKEVDVTSTEGKATLKQCLANVKEAYQAKVDGFGVTAKLEGGNLSVNASGDFTDMGLGQITLGLAAKDFAGNSDFRLAKTENGGVAASIKNSVTGGSLALTGTVPGEKEGSTASINQSLNFAGIGVDAYLSGSKAYVDLSNTVAFVNGVDAFANGLLTDLKSSFIGSMIGYLIPSLLPEVAQDLYDPVSGKFVIAKSYENAPKKIYTDLGAELKWSDLFKDDSQYKIDPEQITEYVATITEKFPALKFKTYDNGAFGFSIDVTKESLKEMMPKDDQSVKAYLDYFTKLDVTAALYVNNKFMIDYAGASFDIALKATDLSSLGVEIPVKDLSLTAALSGKGEVRFNYGNVKPELPAADELAKYEKVEF